MHLPEILAPAGNLEKLKIAILYGANAVYLSGDRFGLRGGADNFSDEDLQTGVTFAHQHRAKVYVTLNSFFHDQDFETFPEYLQFLESINIDGTIVSDLGVVDFITTNSNIPVHLSTQASCLNQYSAKLWKNLGVERIVLGREVSIQQAADIKKIAAIDVEMFIHGSMCMAYSGHCTISNFTAGRDSNRGGCVQSCRFEYSFTNHNQESITQSFMSSKDLQGIELLAKFVKYEIDSLKIEGRMKSNLYVATTVMSYVNGLRTVLSDHEQHHNTQWKTELLKVRHRGYTEASLIKPADSTSVFYGDRQGYSETNFEYAGTVVDVVPDKYLVLMTQNTFEENSILEILDFEGRLHQISTRGMQNIRNREIKKTNPNTIVLIPYSSSMEGIKELNVARFLSNS
ncbi:MAG: U32 family peptidase [SAR324 cluster bacterium]|nr:U32 family peptidase [SAR324 cluster bacterium]